MTTSDWMPIETAPKDGQEFQAWIISETLEWWEPRCRFNADNGAFEIFGRVEYDEDDWSTYPLKASHWMEQPAAPEVKP